MIVFGDGDIVDQTEPEACMPPVGSPFLSDERRQALDVMAGIVRRRAAEFAELTATDRAVLLRDVIEGLSLVATSWVRASCGAKGIDPDSPTAGEEWIGGPAVAIRNARLLAEGWEKIARGKRPHDGLQVRSLANGHSNVRVFPASGLDAALFKGFTCDVLVQDAKQLSGPANPGDGKTCLILGAGNVNSIPAMDVLYKMFVEGRTCVLKMNPVNDYMKDVLGIAFSTLIRRGFLHITSGGSLEGEYLCQHRHIDEVHVTGSNETHDVIVWGPRGKAREARKAANDPLLKKPITSELGNVSPVIIVPGEYAQKELQFMATNVASMLANNGGFNCNAARVVVTSAAWPQRGEFLKRLSMVLQQIPSRLAYYPGAKDRFARLTGISVQDVRRLCQDLPAGHLPWTIVENVDAADAENPLFRSESFCGLAAETALPGLNPRDFLANAVRFCNDVLWGTLNATIMISPQTERTEEGSTALERAIEDLRYGTVVVNHWGALGYGFVSPPWGGAPGGTLADPQSGLGWVHNAFMLRTAVKSVIRGPLTVSPKPAWFCDNAMALEIGRKLAEFEASPSWLKVPGIAFTALRG